MADTKNTNKVTNHVDYTVEIVNDYGGNSLGLNASYLNGKEMSYFASALSVTALSSQLSSKQAGSNILSDITAGLSSTTGSSGFMYLDYDSDTGRYNVSSETIPVMSNAVYGLGKLYSSTVQTISPNAVTAVSGRTYAVQKNSSNQLVVNVPWSYVTYSNATNTNNTSALPNYGLMGLYAYYSNMNVGWSNIVNGSKGVFIRFGTLTNTSKGTATTVTFNQAMKMCVGSSTTQYSANAVSVMLIDGAGMSSGAGYRCDYAITSVSATGFTYLASNTESGTIRYLAIGVYGV